jgi:hypothetical protein
LGAAIALVWGSCCAPAFAQFAQCITFIGEVPVRHASDALQLGDHAPVYICEGAPEGFATGGQAVDAINFDPIAVNPIIQDFQVTLTEPRSGVPPAVSDFVNVDPESFTDLNGQTWLTGLDVTLVSDNEVPLPVSYGNAVIEETGRWQNLNPLITNFYGWTFTIPAVNVMSDVPEPSTWVMMEFGFVALGFAGLRSLRKSAV